MADNNLSYEDGLRHAHDYLTGRRSDNPFSGRAGVNDLAATAPIAAATRPFATPPMLARPQTVTPRSNPNNVVRNSFTPTPPANTQTPATVLPRVTPAGPTPVVGGSQAVRIGPVDKETGVGSGVAEPGQMVKYTASHSTIAPDTGLRTTTLPSGGTTSAYDATTPAGAASLAQIKARPKIEYTPGEEISRKQMVGFFSGGRVKGYRKGGKVRRYQDGGTVEVNRPFLDEVKGVARAVAGSQPSGQLNLVPERGFQDGGRVPSDFSSSARDTQIPISSPSRYRFKTGGQVDSAQDTDTVPAMLSPGEVVLNQNQQRNVQMKPNWQQGLNPKERDAMSHMRLPRARNQRAMTSKKVPRIFSGK